jgi:D-sorbitol dehydrogenase (acceptor)
MTFYADQARKNRWEWVAAFSVPLNVAGQESIDCAVDRIPTRVGIDILINNAAIFDLAPITEITRESDERVFAINVKGALICLTQSAGLNLIKHGINVNAISPGVVDGEHWQGVDALFAKYENRPLGEKKRLVAQEVPFGRMGTAEDLIGKAIFLASSESDYIVAQTFNVDGGNWMN